MARRLSVALLLGLLLAGGHVAGRPAAVDPPAVVALKGATVVVGNGQTVPNAIVVVRGGLIDAVGTKVAAPPGAREVEMKGAFVYPGLIDALTDVGPAETGGEEKPEDATDTESAAMFAHVRAADMLEPTGAANSDRLARGWRADAQRRPEPRRVHGPDRGRQPQRRGPDRMVVKPSAGMRMALQGLGYRNRRRGQGEPGGVYPTRLIGVPSYIRQTLLDAHYYDDALKVYTSQPKGMARPVTSRSMEALLPVARRTLPLIFPAEEQREVQRVIDIADETKVNCIVAGGDEAAAGDCAEGAQDPGAGEPQFPGGRDRRASRLPRWRSACCEFREHAPKAAGELAKAGVRSRSPRAASRAGRDFLPSLRLAVKAGLPRRPHPRGHADGGRDSWASTSNWGASRPARWPTWS